MTATEGASEVLVCFCTCPDRASAESLAQRLVDERLAACVNLLPGATSIYRWEGQIERAEEVLLLVKTVRVRLDALKALVAAHHPYACPELVALEAVGGLPAYLRWVVSETTAVGGDSSIADV
jgi:periplasmic divalent cation tolerance protein